MFKASSSAFSRVPAIYHRLGHDLFADDGNRSRRLLDRDELEFYDQLARHPTLLSLVEEERRWAEQDRMALLTIEHWAPRQSKTELGRG